MPLCRQCIDIQSLCHVWQRCIQSHSMSKHTVQRRIRILHRGAHLLAIDAPVLVCSMYFPHVIGPRRLPYRSTCPIRARPKWLASTRSQSGEPWWTCNTDAGNWTLSCRGRVRQSLRLWLLQSAGAGLKSSSAPVRLGRRLSGYSSSVWRAGQPFAREV